MSADKKLNYLEFPATDFDAVQTFYEKVFDWAFTDYGDDYRAFNDGHMDGGFYRSTLKSGTANGAALVIFYAEDLEQVQADVLAQKGEVIQAIFDFPGGRRFHFTDPHGNELAVWSDKPGSGLKGQVAVK